MAVFRDSDHLYECIGGLFDRMGQDEGIGRKLAAARLLLRFTYSEPDAVISVNCRDAPARAGFFVDWCRGDGGLVPEVDMSMKADIAHRFWLGTLPLLPALARRQIVARGPIPKILTLLPAIKPAYAMYRELLHSKGYGALADG